MSKGSKRRRRERRDQEHREMLARHQMAVENAATDEVPVGDPDVSTLDPVVTNEEIMRIEAVMRFLNRRVGSRIDLESFRVEIIERFREENFVCDPLVYQATYTSGEIAFIFVPKLVGRYGTADLERMKHDMVHDSLDLGEGGIINADGTVRDAPKKTSLWTPPSDR